MSTTPDWHSVIAAESHLPHDSARLLCEIGFVVVPGPIISGGFEQLAHAYDLAVATADPADAGLFSSSRGRQVIFCRCCGNTLAHNLISPPL